jgi:hypothetical protein
MISSKTAQGHVGNLRRIAPTTRESKNSKESGEKRCPCESAGNEMGDYEEADKDSEESGNQMEKYSLPPSHIETLNPFDDSADDYNPAKEHDAG